MNLHSSHTDLACSRRLQLELIACANVTGNQRTGNYGTESLNREYAIYRQSGDCFWIAVGNFSSHLHKLLLELFDSLTGT
jgi:hypothetical protein